jgi:hypothetical protein
MPISQVDRYKYAIEGVEQANEGLRKLKRFDFPSIRAALNGEGAARGGLRKTFIFGHGIDLGIIVGEDGTPRKIAEIRNTQGKVVIGGKEADTKGTLIDTNIQSMVETITSLDGVQDLFVSGQPIQLVILNGLSNGELK